MNSSRAFRRCVQRGTLGKPSKPPWEVTKMDDFTTYLEEMPSPIIIDQPEIYSTLQRDPFSSWKKNQQRPAGDLPSSSAKMPVCGAASCLIVIMLCIFQCNAFLIHMLSAQSKPSKLALKGDSQSLLSSRLLNSLERWGDCNSRHGNVRRQRKLNRRTSSGALANSVPHQSAELDV